MSTTDTIGWKIAKDHANSYTIGKCADEIDSAITKIVERQKRINELVSKAAAGILAQDRNRDNVPNRLLRDAVELIKEPSTPCRDCEGTGEIRVLRDKHGNIDYLAGNFDGETVRCERCQGEGIEV